MYPFHPEFEDHTPYVGKKRSHNQNTEVSYYQILSRFYEKDKRKNLQCLPHIELCN